MNATDLILIQMMMERRRAEAGRGAGHRPQRAENPRHGGRLSWRLGRHLVELGRALEGRGQTAASTREMPSNLAKLMS